MEATKTDRIPSKMTILAEQVLSCCGYSGGRGFWGVALQCSNSAFTMPVAAYLFCDTDSTCIGASEKKASRFPCSAAKHEKPPRRLMGYAIAAKRYALYTQTKGNIFSCKAMVSGRGFLFAPKKIQSE